MRVDRFGRVVAMAAVMLFAVFAFVACTKESSRVDTPSQGRERVEAPAAHEFERLVHADANFNADAKASLDAAADAWRGVSRGRVQIHIAYDLDDETLAGLLAARASVLMVVADDSPIAAQVDARLRDGVRVPLAATMAASDGTAAIVFLGERFKLSRFRALAIHEFGHLIGLPDLPARGAVMSGLDDGEVSELTPTDIALCRSAGLCP